MEKFGYKNPHEVPAIKKIVLNSGFSATADKNHVQYVNDEIAKISGQRPVTTKAKLSISNFKLREGQPIGCKVTLRGAAMYDFLIRLINIALPCIRDFRVCLPVSMAKVTTLSVSTITPSSLKLAPKAPMPRSVWTSASIPALCLMRKAANS